MKKYLSTYGIFIFLIITACNISDGISVDQNVESEISDTILKMLSLGDSYTVGQGVCSSCGFPEQLKDSLNHQLTNQAIIQNEVIAQTGWTTTNLISNINSSSFPNQFDLVTLLIGVNNQYQGKPFSLYESEFPELVNRAILFANGDSSKVIVLSIPDYAFTPFGQANPNITEDINQYNSFAQNFCNTNGITFINITDITRLGLEQPQLVSADGLHPSTIAYTKFVERLIPFAIQKIQ